MDPDQVSRHTAEACHACLTTMSMHGCVWNFGFFQVGYGIYVAGCVLNRNQPATPAAPTL